MTGRLTGELMELDADFEVSPVVGVVDSDGSVRHVAPGAAELEQLVDRMKTGQWADPDRDGR